MWYQDKIELFQDKGTVQDEKFDPVPIPSGWAFLGKCKIHGNDEARTTQAADGSDKIYSYLVTMFIPGIFPKVNDKVRITKADGSIPGKEMSVIGSGTTKNKLFIYL